jgi:hypothetical protein
MLNHLRKNKIWIKYFGLESPLFRTKSEGRNTLLLRHLKNGDLFHCKHCLFYIILLLPIRLFIKEN